MSAASSLSAGDSSAARDAGFRFDFDESVPAEPSVDDPSAPVDDFFEDDDDAEEDDDDAEEESLADVDEESPAAGSAYAMPGVDAMATPTPSVTANAPTRPMCLA